MELSQILTLTVHQAFLLQGLSLLSHCCSNCSDAESIQCISIRCLNRKGDYQESVKDI